MVQHTLKFSFDKTLSSSDVKAHREIFNRQTCAIGFIVDRIGTPVGRHVNITFVSPDSVQTSASLQDLRNALREPASSPRSRPTMLTLVPEPSFAAV